MTTEVGRLEEVRVAQPVPVEMERRPKVHSGQAVEMLRLATLEDL
jgi:hypothetical protein